MSTRIFFFFWAAAAGWRPCAEQAMEKAMCAQSVSVSPCWRELRSPKCWCARAGVSCCPAAPAPAAFQELHLLRPVRVTSQNSNLPAACHFKTGSIEGIAGVLVHFGGLTQLLFPKKPLCYPKHHVRLLTKNKSKMKLLDVFVCYPHSYSFAY